MICSLATLEWLSKSSVFISFLKLFMNVSTSIKAFILSIAQCNHNPHECGLDEKNKLLLKNTLSYAFESAGAYFNLRRARASSAKSAGFTPGILAARRNESGRWRKSFSQAS